MPARPEVHGHTHHESACDCAGHRRHRDPPAPGLWGSLLPVLACAVCPACVATYAKLFSLAGVSVGLTEGQHAILLTAAVAVSVVASGWRAWRARRAWPLAVALAGATLVVAGHRFGEVAWLEWAGVAVLLSGGLVEHVRLRRLATGARPVHA